MNQKIEWYREVLELEPGSRVFFPLAKLLAGDGQANDAIQTLKQGLLRHPDHIEARLLLVELLHSQNAGSEFQKEMDGLSELFASYPGFWSAWSERLAVMPAQLDAALAMRFFAGALQGNTLSWSAVIEQGLRVLLSPEKETPAPSTQDAAPVDTASASSEVSEDLKAYENAADEHLLTPLEEGRLDKGPAPDNDVMEQQTSVDVVSALTESLPEPGALDFEDEDAAQEDEVEEVFSLRTRSMAEVLAEQGDIAGAIDIYDELLASALPEEKDSLAMRIEELNSRLGAPASDENSPAEKSQPSSGESMRLVTLLESLAKRVEARAR